jgi:diphosphomevalonate decarboxylase
MQATARAGSNIAIVKYWGARDLRLSLPANGSISLTLDAATTTTAVQFEAGLKEDVVVLNGREATGNARARVVAHLGRMRSLAHADLFAHVDSANNFPSGAGIASSASGFAALTMAGAAALGLQLSEHEMSALARLGSGSACRSMIGGWAEWLPGTRHEDSYAVQLAPPEHWDVRDVIAIVVESEKPVASSEGHRRAASSPLFGARIAHAETSLENARRAIRARDFAALGATAEADALSMHAIMLTSSPPLLYWLPSTIELMRNVWAWRVDGIPCYFTIDAGPNMHILTLPRALGEVQSRLHALPYVLRVIVCGPGSAPAILPAAETERPD